MEDKYSERTKLTLVAKVIILLILDFIPKEQNILFKVIESTVERETEHLISLIHPQEIRTNLSLGECYINKMILLNSVDFFFSNKGFKSVFFQARKLRGNQSIIKKQF